MWFSSFLDVGTECSTALYSNSTIQYQYLAFTL